MVTNFNQSINLSDEDPIIAMVNKLHKEVDENENQIFTQHQCDQHARNVRCFNIIIIYSVCYRRTNLDTYVFNRYVGEILVPDCICLPVVSVTALTLFIRYIYDLHLHLLNNKIIIKTKVLLPLALGRLWFSCT